MTYIDLNMVRACAVAHPREWEVCGFNEILCPPWRKRIIDLPALFRLLNVETREHLATMRNHLVQEEISSTRRAPAWTESVAVGGEAYLEQVKTDLGLRGKYKRIVTEQGIHALSEVHPGYWPVLGLKTPD
jgi:putative transposase